MTKTFQNTNQQNWLDKAIANFDLYKSKFVVHDEQNIYFASKYATEANDWMRQNKSTYPNLVCFLLSQNFLSRRLLSVRIKSLKNELWEPQKLITFLGYNDNHLEINTLVDSGADTTFIPYLLGIELGFDKNKGDLVKNAFGVGSSIQYIEKGLSIKIDDETLEIPVCWCLNETIDDLLLGREGIFSKYKVIFDEKAKSVTFEKNQIA
jgi:hypothetical protein